jgi:hypothetical protein
VNGKLFLYTPVRSRGRINLDDRFKMLLDPESAPSTISTLLPVRIPFFFEYRLLLNVVLDGKTACRSGSRLPFLLVDGSWRLTHDLIYNPDAPRWPQYAKGQILRKNDLDVLSG